MQNRGDVETFAQKTFPRRQDPCTGETFWTKHGDVETFSGWKISAAVHGFAPLWEVLLILLILPISKHTQ